MMWIPAFVQKMSRGTTIPLNLGWLLAELRNLRTHNLYILMSGYGVTLIAGTSIAPVTANTK